MDWLDIMRSLWNWTQRRVRAHPVLRCFQDAAGLDFNGQAIVGVRPLNYEA